MANPYAKWATAPTPEASPSTNPYARFAAPKPHETPSEWVMHKPPKQAPKPPAKNQTFSQRMKAWMGIPEGATNTQAWMHVAESAGQKALDVAGSFLPGIQVGQALIHPRNPVEAEFQNGAAVGYGPELNGYIYGAVHGKAYGDAVAKRGHEDLEKYRKEAPFTMGAANLAGNVASTEAALAAAPEALGAAGLGGAAALAGRAARFGRRLSRGTAAVGGAAGGAAGAYEGSHEGLIAAAEKAAEGTAVGGTLGYLAPRHLASAALGGITGALQGSGEAGPGHRWEGAVSGGLGGAAIGAVLPSVVEGGVETARAFDAATGYSISRQTDKLYEMWNKALGRHPQARLTPPERAAARRMQAANESSLKPDTKKVIDARQQHREDIGVGKAEKAYQVAGPNIRRLAASASIKSPEAREVAQAETDIVRENMPHSVATQGDLIAPHTKLTTDQHAKMLADQRSEAADVNFREPYAVPVQLDDEAMDIMSSKGMRTAISWAKDAIGESHNLPEAKQQLADIAKIEQYHADLDKWEAGLQNGTHRDGISWAKGQWESLGEDARRYLKGINDPVKRRAESIRFGAVENAEAIKPKPPEVSAGAIDQIRRAAHEHADNLTGTKLLPGENPNRGSRLMDRVNKLNRYLDGLDHLDEARGVHKAYSARMDVMKDGPDKLMSGNAEDFVDWMNDLATGKDGQVHPVLLDAIKQDLRVVLRDAMTGKGHDLPGAAAMLRRIGTDKPLRAKIEEIVGKEETERLVSASKQLRDDLKNANEAEAAGSRTSRDLSADPWIAELGHLTQPGKLMHNFFTAAMRNGRTMTAEEGQAMIDLLHGDPHTLMGVIEAKPDGLLAEGVRLGLARAAGGYMGGRQNDTGQGDLMPPVEKLEDVPMTDDGGIEGVVHDPTPSPYDPPTPTPTPEPQP